MPRIGQCGWLAALLVAGSALAVASEVTNDVGALKVSSASAVISRDAASSGRSQIQATMELTIKNTGAEALRVALFRPVSLQMENGATFKLNKVFGLADCVRRSAADCDRASMDFPILYPGESLALTLRFEGNASERSLRSFKTARLSGSIYVRSEEDGGWPQTLSLTNIPVNIAID